MNIPQDPMSDSIVTMEEWKAVSGIPAGGLGPAYLGLDIGGSVSACAASLYFPETGLLLVTGAWPKNPGLHERGLSDGVGDRYERMEERAGRSSLWASIGRMRVRSSVTSWNG